MATLGKVVHSDPSAGGTWRDTTRGDWETLKMAETSVLRVTSERSQNVGRTRIFDICSPSSLTCSSQNESPSPSPMAPQISNRLKQLPHMQSFLFEVF